MTAGSAFADRPDCRVDIHRRRNRVTGTVGDTVVADTAAALLVDEQDHSLVFCFPRFDGGGDGDGGGDPVCWSYDDPTPETALLRGHIAFDQDRVAVRVGR